MGRRLIIISIISLVTLMSSCHTSRNIPSSPVIVTNTDSVVTTYVERVRIDTVRVEVPVPMETAMQVVNDSTSHLETTLAESDAWLNLDGTLGHSLKNKETKLTTEVLVTDKTTERSGSKVSIKELPVAYPEYQYVERDFSAWERFRLKAFWPLSLFFVVILLFSLRKLAEKLHIK